MNVHAETCGDLGDLAANVSVAKDTTNKMVRRGAKEPVSDNLHSQAHRIFGIFIRVRIHPFPLLLKVEVVRDWLG